MRPCVVAGRRVGAAGKADALAMMTIDLPAMRHYPNGGALIERLFAEEARAANRPRLAIAPAVLHLLRAKAWPGNFHEARLTLRHMLTLCEGDRVEVEHLPESLRPEESEGADHEFAERCAPQAALDLNGWNVSRAAHYLDVSRATLNRRIRHFDLERPRRD